MNRDIGPIALTPGEPAGIGPDLCVQLAATERAAAIVAIADRDLLESRARQLGIGLTVEPSRPGRLPARAAGRLTVDHVPLRAPAEPGRLEPANAPYVLDTLRKAAGGVLEGTYSALVTGPVHKGVINDAGRPFTGHTEFLAELTGGDPVMMLACPGLRVALATTHLPLAKVSQAITPALLERVLDVIHRDLAERFGIRSPRVLVCGLNPHAGENGHLGTEELEIIAPTLERLREGGMDLVGPLPADTLFTPRYLEEADAVLAMYHDQGLPVLKHLGFGRSVNITLGLPIIRTSVDHGTALELAGTGRAEATSLLEAVACAQSLAASNARGNTPVGSASGVS